MPKCEGPGAPYNQNALRSVQAESYEIGRQVALKSATFQLFVLGTPWRGKEEIHNRLCSIRRRWLISSRLLNTYPPAPLVLYRKNHSSTVLDGRL